MKVKNRRGGGAGERLLVALVSLRGSPDFRINHTVTLGHAFVIEGVCLFSFFFCFVV